MRKEILCFKKPTTRKHPSRNQTKERKNVLNQVLKKIYPDEVDRAERYFN